MSQNKSSKPDGADAEYAVEKFVSKANQARTEFDKGVVEETKTLVRETELRLIEAHSKETKQSLEVIEEAATSLVTSVEVVSKSESGGGEDHNAVQALRADLESLRRTVSFEKKQREKNTASVLELRERFALFEGMVQKVTAGMAEK